MGVAQIPIAILFSPKFYVASLANTTVNHHTIILLIHK